LSVLKLFAAVLLLAAAGTAQDLKVAAAADLTSVMPKLSAAFQKQTGISLSVSLGSSGNFFAQIRNGAPFDVFMSADKSYPEKLQDSGLTLAGTLFTYARGKLVLWVPNGSRLQFSSNKDGVLTGDLGPLAGAAVQKIAIANPEHAPYGRAAVAALEHYRIYEAVKSKLILGENISQAAQFGQSGNADAALISDSIALTAAMKQKGTFVLLPQESYPPLDQAVVVPKSSKNEQLARRFVEFLRSAQAIAIFRQFGFEVTT
jgi:molybdate transport system substrate-binding protein